MMHAYRLVYPLSEHAPPQLWEYEQPYIDNLLLNARTFDRFVTQWYFEDWAALDSDILVCHLVMFVFLPSIPMDARSFCVVCLLHELLCVFWVVIDIVHASPRGAIIRLDSDTLLCFHDGECPSMAHMRGWH